VKRKQPRKEARALSIIAFIAFAAVLLAIPVVSAASAITLNPTSQAPTGSVNVSGTSFGATKSVGIGFGAEVAATDFNMPYTGTGMGPYTGNVSGPIKPGSFVLFSDTTAGGGIVSTYTDNGAGITMWSYDDTPMGTINYVTGVWTRSSTVDVSGIETNYTATYTRYQYNVTSAAGITTSASGDFTAPITVPAVADGTYTVTAIDTQGNRATSPLTVAAVIPENISLIAIMLLFGIAAVVGARYLRNDPQARVAVK